MKKLMIKCKAYWKAVTPAAATISITANALGPNNPWWYVVTGLLALAGVVFGPKNATPQEVADQLQVLRDQIAAAKGHPLPQIPLATPEQPVPPTKPIGGP